MLEELGTRGQLSIETSGFESPEPIASPVEIPEILAPAGGPEQFFAALHTGADAVYLGLSRFNARARATNFSIETLAEHLPIARQHGMKVLVTLNTLIKDVELEDLLKVIAQLSALDVHALIVQDLGLAALCREYFPTLRLHASTQMALHNADGVQFAKKMGFQRVVLARELTATEMRKIRKQFPREEMEIEAFCHGSLCYSYSGLCFFSGAEDARSGNRGECAYTCRKPYKIVSEAGGGFLFSMKDLNTLHSLDILLNTGVDTLKIEGRKKDAQYVASTVRAYRTRLDAIMGYPTLRQSAPAIAHELYRPGHNPSKEIEEGLRFSYSRASTSLFLKGRYAENVIDLENPTHQGILVGQIQSIRERERGIFALHLKTQTKIELFDGLRLEASVPEHASRYHNLRPEFSLRELRASGARCPTALAGSVVEIDIPAELASAVSKGDRIFKIRSNELKTKTDRISRPTGDERLGHRLPIDMEIKVHLQDGNENSPHREVVLNLRASFRRVNLVERQWVFPLEERRSSGPPLSEDIKSAFAVFGDGLFEVSRFEWNDTENVTSAAFLPRSHLKSWKRELARDLVLSLGEFQSQALQSAQSAISRKSPFSAKVVSDLAVKIDRIEYLETLKDLFAWAWDKQSGAYPHLSSELLLQPTELIFEPKRSLLGTLKAEALWSTLVSWSQQLSDQCGHAITITCALPTVIRAWDEPLLLRTVQVAWQLGIRRFEIGNPGALLFLERAGIPIDSKELVIASDFTVYAMNRSASLSLANLGVSRIALSLEDDKTDLQNHVENWLSQGAKPQLILYKDTPLFIAESCTLTALHNGCPSSSVCGYRSLEVEDEQGERYIVAHESCKSVVYGKRAFSITQHLTEACNWGLRDFRIDFLTREYSPSEIREILSGALSGTAIANTVSGNFTGKLL